MAGHLVSEGEQAANEARQALGLGLDAPISVLAAVEDLAGIPVCVAEFDPDVAGLFIRRHGRHYVFVNGTHSVERQRFTLAHEYGHSRMNHAPRVESTDRMYSKDPQEVAANYFAGAFLAPRQAVRNWVERHPDLDVDLEMVVRVAAFFGTSAEVSRIRLEKAGVLTTTASNRLKQRIKDTEHYGMLARIGISGYADALSRLRRDVETEVRTLPRLPSNMVRKAREAADQDLVEQDELEALLRGTPVADEAEDELSR